MFHALIASHPMIAIVLGIVALLAIVVLCAPQGFSDILEQRMDSIPYISGGEQSINVPKGDVIRQISLNMSQQPTVTSGNNTVARTGNGDGLAAIDYIRVEANGSDPLLYCPGYALRMLNYFLERANPKIGSVQLGDGATANPVLNDVVNLPFLSGGKIIKPSDLWVWPQPLSQFTIKVKWKTNAYAVVSTSASAYTAAPLIETSYIPASLGMDLSKSPPIPMIPKVGLRITPKNVSFAGSGVEQKIELDAGRFAYMGLIIRASTSNQDTANLFSKVQVMNGTRNVFNCTETKLFAESRQGMEIPYLRTTAGIPYLATPGVSPLQSHVGWYHINFVKNGRLTEAQRTNGSDKFLLLFDTNAAVDFEVYQLGLMPLGPSGAPSGD